MGDRFGKVWWSLELAEGWSGQFDDVCATITTSGGCGALQVSACMKESEVVDADLEEFAAEHLEAGAKRWNVKLGDFVGFSFHYGDEENYWRQWYLRHGAVAVFVTYNCDLNDRGIEDGPVDEMLQSLRSEV